MLEAELDEDGGYPARGRENLNIPNQITLVKETEEKKSSRDLN